MHVLRQQLPAHAAMLLFFYRSAGATDNYTENAPNLTRASPCMVHVLSANTLPNPVKLLGLLLRGSMPTATQQRPLLFFLAHKKIVAVQQGFKPE